MKLETKDKWVKRWGLRSLLVVGLVGLMGFLVGCQSTGPRSAHKLHVRPGPIGKGVPTMQRVPRTAAEKA